MIVLVLPEVHAVVGRAGAAVGASLGDGHHGAQFGQVQLEVGKRGIDIALAGGEAFVVVAGVMSEGYNLADDAFVVAFGHGAEVVGGL